MLKGVGFKLQVQLTTEKGRQFLPYSTNQKIAETKILQIFKSILKVKYVYKTLRTFKPQIYKLSIQV